MIFQSFVAQVCGAIFFTILHFFMEHVIFSDCYVFLMTFYVFLLIFHKKGDGGGGGRIFLEDPTPINPRRDNISRKDNPSLRYIYIYNKPPIRG